MTSSALETRRTRRTAALCATLAVALVAMVFVMYQAASDVTSAAGQPFGGGPAEHQGPPTASDGVIRDDQHISVFDDVPAVTQLDPELRSALRRAAKQASVSEGIAMQINSGWRSPAYQEQLLDEAVTKYGSREEAERWVATPETSEHVSGQAVDVGPWQAAEWLGRHGAGYGLCQIYENEAWHFELRPDAVTAGCPRMYRDASQRER